MMDGGACARFHPRVVVDGRALRRVRGDSGAGLYEAGQGQANVNN